MSSIIVPPEAIEAALAKHLEVFQRYPADPGTERNAELLAADAMRAALEAALPFLVPEPTSDDDDFCIMVLAAVVALHDLLGRSRATTKWNRTSQRTYDDGLRRAAEIVNHWGGPALEPFIKEILAELKPEGEGR